MAPGCHTRIIRANSMAAFSDMNTDVFLWGGGAWLTDKFSKTSAAQL